ncbi:MAG: DSD1 family PLP-dependent enzyme [Burkholderiaceae bacterium]
MDARWIPPAPARAGDALANVDTPALILDLDKFEGNLRRMVDATRAAGVRLRPHAKSHKCVAIARRQVAAGAVGVCCQKVSEAEVFVAEGIADVLITNEVVGEQKLYRLADLARRYPNARIGVCVDDLGIARQIGAICQQEGARLDVYVELDVGQNRCGVIDASTAVAIAKAVVASPKLTFMGLQAYAGSAQHRRGVPERRAGALAAARKAEEVRAAFRANDIPCEVITGGGTGTFAYEAASGVYNEVQPGSFALMDVDYARNEADPHTPRFEHALFVLATVISLRSGEGYERATLDAGLKAFSTDSGPALPTFPGWQVRAVSDEHTVMHRSGHGPPVKLGDKALLVPGHCDPTVNLHDWIVAIRKGVVEAVWPVDARGAVF